jgi:hypothetical protein
LTIPSYQLHIAKGVCKLPPVLSLAINLEIVPLYVRNTPPATIFPSDWIAMELIVSLNPHQMLKEVSLVPSVLSLTILLVVAPLYIPKAPPATIFPSTWIARE